MASFVRKVPTASGARAVQIVHKQAVRSSGSHIGSAHDDAGLALLMEVARRRLHPGQETFDLGPAAGGGGPGVGGRILSTHSKVLWDVMTGAYAQLGFDAVDDEAFAAMVLARIVEPTSKADTVRVLGELGVRCPSLRTLFRSLQRCQERDYRDVVAKACLAHSARTTGQAALVMYDVTTLHFENEDEDSLRKVGMSE